MSELATKSCAPCRGSIPPLGRAEIARFLSELTSGWEVIAEHHLKKEFKFPDFRTALDFTNQVGALAEAQDHHPDIYLAWGKVEIILWTHKIDGLHENDFILAAKIDQVQAP